MFLEIYRKAGFGERLRQSTTRPTSHYVDGSGRLFDSTHQMPDISRNATVTGEGSQVVTAVLAGTFPTLRDMTASIGYSIGSGATMSFDVSIPVGTTLA